MQREYTRIKKLETELPREFIRIKNLETELQREYIRNNRYRGQMYMAQFDTNYNHSEITTMDIADDKFLGDIKNDHGNFYGIDDAMRQTVIENWFWFDWGHIFWFSWFGPRV